MNETNRAQRSTFICLWQTSNQMGVLFTTCRIWCECRCFSCCIVTRWTLCLNVSEGEISSVLHLRLVDRNVQLRVRQPADLLSVSHQRGASRSAGVRRDLYLSSVYHSSISLVPFLPLTVRLMMCWVKPKGRAALGTIQSRNRGDSSSSPCLKMKKQKALI